MKEPSLSVVNPLRGANQCRQYVGTVSYASLVQSGEDTIKVEVGLREPLRGQLTTRLRPVLRQSDFDEFDLDRAMGTVLQISEALAAS